MNISSSDIHFQTMKYVRLELRGPPRGPELSLEPAVENWVTDTGAHGDQMTEAESEVVDLNITPCTLTTVVPRRPHLLERNNLFRLKELLTQQTSLYH